ncbi:MAG: bifunctional phosphopantothenoylcysteine decarboxylase/phosphopantothenate--cysteine ligase CoaBC [Conexivisphaerales archaeon]
MEKPLDEIAGKLGDELSGRKIVHCITGSISAYRAPDIARLLIRHGAEVIAVMSEDAQKIIHKNVMEWATGHAPVTELTGRIEHVALTSGSNKADLILVAPATANTIGKIASGIDDTPVTSVVSSALGAKIPILVAPAMHETMIQHPIINDNIRRLTENGTVFIPPKREEGKAKLAEDETILEYIIHTLTKKDMIGMKVLVTGGPTVERIDPIRFITNRSSGKTGVAFAKEASARGAEVTLVTGPTEERIEEWIEKVDVETAEEMFGAVSSKLKERRYDMVIATAAVSDYAPAGVSQNKLRSEEKERITLELIRTPKIIDKVKELSDVFLIIFKAEHNISREELIQRGIERMKEAKADMAVLNDVSKIGFGSEENEVIIVNRNGDIRQLPRMSKRAIARTVLDEALKALSSS